MSDLVHRRLRPDTGDESGVTLIEMVVVIGILSLVLAMVMGMMIAITKITGQNAGRIDQSQQAKVAVDSMSKTIRTAVLPQLLSCSTCDDTVFVSGTVRAMQFYGNLDNDDTLVLSPSTWTNRGPSKISYSVDADGKLTETIRHPDYHLASNTEYTYGCTAGTANCLVSTRVIARGVSTTKTLFTYYDKNGTVVPPPLSGDELSSVYGMDITLSVNTVPNIPASEVVTRVTLPNAGIVGNDTDSTP